MRLSGWLDRLAECPSNKMKHPFLPQTNLPQTTIYKASIVFICPTTTSSFAKTFIITDHVAMVFHSPTSSHIVGGVRLLEGFQPASVNLIVCNSAKNTTFVEGKAYIATSKGALFSESYPITRTSLPHHRKCEAFACEKTSLAQYPMFVLQFLGSLATPVNFPHMIPVKKSLSACVSIGSNT